MNPLAAAGSERPVRAIAVAEITSEPRRSGRGRREGLTDFTYNHKLDEIVHPATAAWNERQAEAGRDLIGRRMRHHRGV
ncbi:hypothetical protein [Planotetraspora phitsanulokensis]|uniref:hypothetical protein n=1 Tax=Planotetraspora phitsanulokensis TaxID=575192 RepID=UPI00194F46F2|nr:hypothetical protein [Planotetraspora phitsanulokensis]